MSKKIPGKYKGQPRNYYHYMCSAYMRSGGEICTKHSIKNDELEKAETDMVALKGSVNVKEYEMAVSELDKSVYVLQHIEDKYKFELVNIF